MINSKYPRSETTARVIACAFEVHNTLGRGFQELIYQRAMFYEMKRQGLFFEREKEMMIFYKDIELGKRRVDFLVEYKVMVELKAVIEMEDAHLAQGLNYLVAYKMDKGLLINFGSPSLEVKRLLHPKKRN